MKTLRIALLVAPFLMAARCGVVTRDDRVSLSRAAARLLFGGKAGGAGTFARLVGLAERANFLDLAEATSA